MIRHINKKTMGVILTVLFFLLMILIWNAVSLLRPATQEEETVRAGKKVRIICSFDILPMKQALGKLADAYGRLDGAAEIEVDYVTPNEFRKALADSEENGYDIMFTDPFLISPIAALNELTAVDVQAQQMESEGVWREAIAAGTVDGISYGLPVSFDPYVLYYDRDFYTDALGNDLVAECTSWQELTELFLEKQREGRGDGSWNALGVSGSGQEDFGVAFLSLLCSEGGKPSEFTSDVSQMVLASMNEMSRGGVLTEEMSSWNQVDLMQYYTEGSVKAALGKLSGRSLLDASSPRFLSAVRTLPGEKRDGETLYNGVFACLNKRASVNGTKFIAWVTQPQQLKLFNETAGGIAPLDDWEEQGDFADRITVTDSCPSWFGFIRALHEELKGILQDSSVMIEVRMRRLEENAHTEGAVQ